MKTHEINNQPQEKVYVEHYRELILDALKKIEKTDIETLEIKTQRLMERVEGEKKLVDDKKQELALSIKNKRPHEEIEVLVAELVHKERCLKEIEVYYALYLSALEKRDK